jgi:hypothetical protein
MPNYMHQFSVVPVFVVLPVTRGMWIHVLRSSFGIFIVSSFEFAWHSSPHKCQIIMIGHRAAHVGRGRGR